MFNRFDIVFAEFLVDLNESILQTYTIKDVWIRPACQETFSDEINIGFRIVGSAIKVKNNIQIK